MPTPLEIVTRFLRAMEQKDYDAGVRWIAPDCEYTNLPAGMGTARGPAGVRAVLEPFFAPTLENEFRVLRTAVNGEIVFCERLDRHRLASGWVELPVTGVFEVRGGLIHVWREYFDLPTLTQHWPTA